MIKLNSILFMTFFGLFVPSILGAPTTTQFGKRQEVTPTPGTPSTPSPSPTSSSAVPDVTTNTGTNTSPSVTSTSGLGPFTSSYAIGACASNTTLPSATALCSVPTTTPFADYLYPNVSFSPECHLIELCNEGYWGGDCLSVPIYVNGTGSDSCEYLDLTSSCLTFPDRFDSDFSSFTEYYGGLRTVSARAGNNYNCSLYTTPYCEFEGTMELRGLESDGWWNITHWWLNRDWTVDLVPFLSFHCWPKGEGEPGWSETSIDPVPLPTAVTVSKNDATALASALASVDTYLANDFNPFIDEILICGEYGLANCIAMNSTNGCGTPGGAPGLTAEILLGYDTSCIFYNDSSCSTSVTNYAMPTMKRFDQLVNDLVSEWGFNCARNECARETGAGYSSCGSALSVLTSDLNVVVTPIATVASWSWSSTSTGAGSSTTTLPNTLTAPVGTPPADPPVTGNPTSTTNPSLTGDSATSTSNCVSESITTSVVNFSTVDGSGNSVATSSTSFWTVTSTC